MTLKVEVNYADSIPQTAVPGFAPRGAAAHWTAGGTGRAGALGTIRHFQSTRYTVNASYHLLVWWDPAAQVTGAMWIVPPDKASHSMNPANAYKPKTGSTLEAERFAEVRRILGLKASDPNAGCISISFCGMPADLAAALRSPVFVADMRRLLADLKAILSMLDRPLFNHGWIQPLTRYDAGDALIPAIYLTPEDDMAYLDTLKPIINRRVTIGKGATARTSPAWDASDPDANAITVHAADTTRTAVAWVTGTKLIGLKGEVYSDDPTWLMTDRYAKPGVTYYHKQDVIRLEPIEATGVTPEQLGQAKRLEFGRGRDEGIAAYTGAGVKAAKAVTP